MSLLDRILGRPLATQEESEHRVGVWEGIPMLGLDALGSSAYGPEAALTILIPLGAAASGYALPVIAVITALLFVVYISYRQTIAAYPNGGGSYTVAGENLGQFAGVVAAAALILDYILNAAVGISAGVGALVSAVPTLHPYILPLCLGILALITVVNLRGVRESGSAFALPTYSFLVCMAVVLVLGLFRTVVSGGHPEPVAKLPEAHAATAGLSLWLLIRAFASGCTAMTGVEAVSNGVLAFRDPTVKNAERTLTVLVAALACLLLGIGVLGRAYGITATNPEGHGYQSVISQLVGAVVGRGWFYYLTLGSTLSILALSANTSFAGFPRLCRLLANDEYLPHAFANRGRRLVYSIGIVVLAMLAGLLLTIFGGITDRLIPLFAVGALLAFTMSQAGMVFHWYVRSDSKSRHKMVVNMVGAVCTFAALIVVLAAKFVEGAWITVLLIAGMIWLFSSVKGHYRHVATETICDQPLATDDLRTPIVIVPMMRWSTVSYKALRFAMSISTEVAALHVSTDDDGERMIREQWEKYVAAPLRDSDRPEPRLQVVRSPYRRVFKPLLSFLVEEERRNPGRTVAVVIPELVESRWYQYFLHNQRATMLKAALLFHGGSRVVVMNVPWYLGDPEREATEPRAPEDRFVTRRGGSSSGSSPTPDPSPRSSRSRGAAPERPE